jgi:hypothetical protein
VVGGGSRRPPGRESRDGHSGIGSGESTLRTAAVTCSSTVPACQMAT